MTMKYEKLLVVKLKSFHWNEEIDNCIIIKSQAETDDFDVDLTSDCWFNTEFKITEIHKEIPINSLEDVYKYCKEHDITIDKDRINNKGLIVGGEKDFLIDHDLTGSWIIN